MKIIKLAIEDIENYDLPEKSHSFNHIFGNKQRILIPYGNKITFKEIIQRLQEGDTKTGSRYLVDAEQHTIRKIRSDGSFDNREFKLRRVIQFELGPEYLRQYEIIRDKGIHPEEEDGKYYIILSRDPLDIIRMSDHKGISSCHSPHGEYFSHCIREAQNGGAVAYLVSEEELDMLKSLNIDLDDPEIFEDRDRGIRGIRPTSRMRVVKYESPDGEELAVPVKSTYGDKSFSELYSHLRDFLLEEQSDDFDLENLTIDNRWTRVGGAYSDVLDYHILNSFLNKPPNIDVQDSLVMSFDDDDYVGNEVLALWDQEIRNGMGEYDRLEMDFGYNLEVEDLNYMEIETVAEVIYTYENTELVREDIDFIHSVANTINDYIKNVTGGPQESLKFSVEVSTDVRYNSEIKELSIQIRYSSSDATNADEAIEFFEQMAEWYDENYEMFYSMVYNAVVYSKILKNPINTEEFVQLNKGYEGEEDPVNELVNVSDYEIRIKTKCKFVEKRLKQIADISISQYITSVFLEINQLQFDFVSKRNLKESVNVRIIAKVYPDNLNLVAVYVFVSNAIRIGSEIVHFLYHRRKELQDVIYKNIEKVDNLMYNSIIKDVNKEEIQDFINDTGRTVNKYYKAISIIKNQQHYDPAILKISKTK